MRKILLNEAAADGNALALADALNAYGKAFFDSAAAIGDTVTCTIGGQTAATFQIADFLPVTWSGAGGTTYTIAGESQYPYNRFPAVWFFDNAFCLFHGNATGEIDTRRGVIITKDKSGATTVIFFWDGANTTPYRTKSAEGAQAAYTVAAIPCFGEIATYTHSRVNRIGSDDPKTFAVPVWTGDSYTEDVLAVAIATTTQNYAPFHQTVNGESFYAVLTGSFLVRDGGE